VETNQKRQTDSQPAPNAPLKARARFAVAAALGVFGSIAALTLTGCPANLENPERFDDAGSMVNNDPNAAPACLTTAFNKVCGTAGCHDPMSTTLNLVSPDVASRLVNVTAKHALADTTMCPSMPVKYIDTANPSASWLLTKLNNMQGNCGVKMPEIGTWTADEATCLNNWIQTLSMGSGSGSGGAAATAGGSGGATATSGGSGGAGTASGGAANGASGSAGTGGA